MDSIFSLMCAELPYGAAALLLRLTIGLGLLPYGIEKYRTRDSADKFPAVFFFNSKQSFYASLLVESLSSLCLIFGFLTRLAALAGLCNMCVAVSMNLKWKSGVQQIMPAIILALGMFSIILVGAGPISLDYLLLGK